MKEILIFSGTTEGRLLSEVLVKANVLHTICVATEYGEIVLQENPLVKIHKGRMNADEMKEFICSGNYQVVVDATHPYADIVSKNIREALYGMDIPYIRLLRHNVDLEQENIRYFETNEDCEIALREMEGNILLTTGSKEIGKYCISNGVKSRIYARVLPSMESIELCERQGIIGKQIIAMQGPFSTEMNEALLRQYDISVLVTKESGKAGGFPEKIEAAKRVCCKVFVIGRPKDTEGFYFDEVCMRLEQLCKVSIEREPLIEVTLVGIGMGSRSNMTKEVCEVIEKADILLGAHRILKGVAEGKEHYSYYLPSQIIPFLKELQEKNITDKKRITVLFSGDTGFNSGCKALYHSLNECNENGLLNISVKVLPGISSVAYLAAHMGESYDDAKICSIHGKHIYNLVEVIRTNSKTFLLTSGVKDINMLGNLLLKSHLESCEIIAGYQLSYSEEKIFSLTPHECVELEKDGLYICLIRNPYAKKKRLTHGINDRMFLRDKVPMTKEEVREVSICKLKLHEQAICYDIGSGTGSIAVEMAALSNKVRVYAIEQKSEAVSLIEQNKELFGLENIQVIEAKAPEGLEELPKPTHAFIGGSSGNMKDILDTLYAKNSIMRVVINAISIETICEIKDALSQFPVEDEDIVQIQVSRAKQVGRYHLMQAENPIWICSFQFCEKK